MTLDSSLQTSRHLGSLKSALRSSLLTPDSSLLTFRSIPHLGVVRLLGITDKYPMECQIGQKVCVKGKAWGFRLKTSTGEVISIDDERQLALVRFQDDQSSYFTEDQLIPFKEISTIKAFLLAMIFVALFSFIFIFTMRFSVS